MLTYDTTELSSPVATKNLEVWYFGDEAPGHSYMDPEITETETPPQPQGKVVFIVGKMDSTPEAEQGVNGPRVKVGDVTF